MFLSPSHACMFSVFKKIGINLQRQCFFYVMAAAVIVVSAGLFFEAWALS